MSEPSAITLTATEARLVLYAVLDLIARRTLGNRPLPPGFGPLRDRLLNSADGTKTCAPQSQSALSATEELIDTAEAAAILGCSDRWVRRIHVELGGRDIGRRHVFPRQTVVQYAQRKAAQQPWTQSSTSVSESSSTSANCPTRSSSNSSSARERQAENLNHQKPITPHS